MKTAIANNPDSENKKRLKEKIFRRWVTKGSISKQKVTPRKLGGIKYEYRLTSGGTALLENIISLVQREFPKASNSEKSRK